MSILQSITHSDLSNIFGSNQRKMDFLTMMVDQWNVPTKVTKGKTTIDKKKVGNVDDYIISRWDYSICKMKIREMFETTDKFTRGRDAKDTFNLIKEEYLRRGFTDYNWPFAAIQFDDYIVRNAVYPTISYTPNLNDLIDKTARDVEKFTFLKLFNTLRNDYIEYLMYMEDEDIIPTLSHRGGVDFYIHGIAFDQKVSRSVTNEFKDKHGDMWREQAINNPLEVCGFLMSLGDEARFTNVPRLFVIDVDGTYDLDGIEDKISSIDFDSPTEVTYTYKHKTTGDKEYTCPVLYLMLTN